MYASLTRKAQFQDKFKIKRIWQINFINLGTFAFQLQARVIPLEIKILWDQKEQDPMREVEGNVKKSWYN